MPSRLLAWSNWIYAGMLRAYPPDFRRRFSLEMSQVFRSMSKDVYKRSGWKGLITLWVPAAWDLVQNAGYHWIIYLLSQMGKRMDTTELDRQIGDLTWCISTGLRAGYSLRQVFEVMAKIAPEPAASTCKRLMDDLEQGQSFETALATWKKNQPSGPLARLADMFLHHRQVGGNLADLLDPLSDDLVRQHGSDPAFHPVMRGSAEQLGAPIPERVRQDS